MITGDVAITRRIPFLIVANWTAPVVLFGMLTLGWFITPDQISSYKICLIKEFTDLDCPGCGLTRAFLLLARGQIGAAVTLNAAAPLLYLFFVQMLVTQVSEKLGRPLLISPFWQSSRIVSGWLILAVLLGHWVVKLSAQLPLP